MNLLEIQAKRILELYSQKITNHGLSVSGISKAAYNYELKVSNGNENVKIQVYFGKKGNKVVIQGNKASELYSIVNNIVNGESFFNEGVNKVSEPDIYIGTDESGKGDYFGPLVIAGVFVNHKTSLELKKIGVKDSKQLSDSSIKSISAEIVKIVKDGYNILTISPDKYNDLYKKFNNLNRLLGWAHASVLENILKKHKAPEAISDKFGDEKYIIISLQSHGKLIKLHQEVRAEKYTAVAAASILARNKFNEWFESKNLELNLELPKGASQKVEQSALEIKNLYGIDFLSKLVKLHFKTSKKLDIN